MPQGARTIDGKAELIQMLIPLGLKAVSDELQAELAQLTGERYRHDGGPMRWGKQAGSVYLGDEKFRIEVPRVRDGKESREVCLESYGRFQRPRGLDEGVMKKVLLGLCQWRSKIPPLWRVNFPPCLAAIFGARVVG